MSDSALKRINVGAYDKPFSGVGIEYYPLGGEFDHTGLLIHEVGFLPRNSNWNFPGVFSPFWRLYYNSEPGHGISFQGDFYHLKPDHLMLIPNHQLFHCLGKNPVPTFWMAFSTDRLISPIQKTPILLKPTSTTRSLIEDIKGLIVRNTYYSPTDQIYRNSLALLNVVIANTDIDWKKENPAMLNKLLDYIATNCDKQLSNSHLAQVACMSIEGLSKMFRTHMGTSPAAYVTQIRIKQASYLLLNTSESIDRIAEKTGFPNRNYFSRVFKKISNQSPAQFRQLHHNL
ncbi:Arabinose operon regulatory protein [Anaerohalosphaera lusitana]|uniref:Arabinose operon regulatory protein n=1 Tax=Anaerohalosphaera lusitana TaxID=1936003 RepID=A0A1U9NMQ8_9BACT|nr:AraC family transcriptional regulator [Anaerohalosphaera lusitana]AQT69189.1 Arabinose operon regulatory protein [Anaerohalosphaera lusitana]